MKTLMQMFAEQDKGVVFFETITSHKYQTHSYIECIPVPFDLFDQLPIYFRVCPPSFPSPPFPPLTPLLPPPSQEAISTSESEWSQHQKLLTFTPSRPFRRALVPNLPYFAVQFDYKGEKGYGHVIEGVDDAPDRDNDGEEQAGMVGEKGGGEFPKCVCAFLSLFFLLLRPLEIDLLTVLPSVPSLPFHSPLIRRFSLPPSSSPSPLTSPPAVPLLPRRFFAQEILGNLLSLPSPRLWRKPKRLDRRDGKKRVDKFREAYAKWDWTVGLAG